MYQKEDYPITERFIASREKRELIQDFLEYAHLNGADLKKEVEYAENAYTHVLADESELLDGFFGIDQNKMEAERAEMLKELKGEN